MPHMEWSEDLSVGVAEMDEQHKKWIAIMNELHDSLMQSAETTTLEKIVAKMEAYTGYHFDAEEAMLEKANFPDISRHRRTHFGFRQEIIRLKRDILGGELVLQTQVMSILKNWLLDHIRKSDKEYGEFLKKQG